MGFVVWLKPANCFREDPIVFEGLRYILLFLYVCARWNKQYLRSGTYITGEQFVPILLLVQHRNLIIQNYIFSNNILVVFIENHSMECHNIICGFITVYI